MAEEKKSDQSEEQKLLAELKRMIKAFIETCDAKVTPNICRIAQNPEGYDMIERAIIKKCSDSAMPVGSAMAEYENDLAHAYE